MWAAILQIINFILGITDRLTTFFLNRADEAKKKRDEAQRRMDEAAKKGDYDAFWGAHSDKRSA